MFANDTEGFDVGLGLDGVSVGLSNEDLSMGLGEGYTPAEIDFRKRLGTGDVLMSMNGMGEEDASVVIGKSALFPGQFWMTRNAGVMIGSGMREDGGGHPQSASPTRGAGSGIGIITSPMGYSDLGLGLGNVGMSTLGLETISPSMISPPLASICPPTASLAQLGGMGGMLIKAEDNPIESWRDAQSSSGSASGSPLPVSPVEGISPRMLGGFAGGEFYQPANYGPYPDVITHQSPISTTAATATSQMPSYYQPGNVNTPAQYIGWDAAPPPMLATGRNRNSYGGESSDGGGDGGRVLLGGANAKVPEDRQRQRVVQACEKCRERKAACNGHVPCKRCTDKKLSCVYAPVRRMRGPNKVKKAPGSRKESMAAAKAAKARTSGGVALTISTRRSSGGALGHARRGSDVRHHMDVKMEEPPLSSGTRGESYSPSEPMEMGNHGYSLEEHEFSGDATSASNNTPMMPTPAGFLHNQITGGYHVNGGGEYGMEEHNSPLLKSAPSRPSQLPTSPLTGPSPFRNYPGSTKIQPTKRLPGSPGDVSHMQYQAMTVPIPGPNAAFVTSYFDHQPNPQPYAYSSSYDSASHISDVSAARYQFGAQAGNQLGYPGPAYSASHPTSVTFSTMYNQRGGAGNIPQHSPSLIQANTSPLSPSSAPRSLYPTPMTGSQATLLESPMSEDPPLVGLGVHGATYSLPAQSNVRSMAIGSSRVASGGGMPSGPSHSPLGLIGTSPRVDAPTPGIWGAGSGTANTSSPYAGGNTSVDEGVEMSGGVFDSADKADSMAATPDRAGWAEQGTYFNESTTTGRWS